jgi:hypothetical protein
LVVAAVRITGGWQAHHLGEAEVRVGWGVLANMVGGTVMALVPER